MGLSLVFLAAWLNQLHTHKVHTHLTETRYHHIYNT
jgi:hypothetical protein